MPHVLRHTAATWLRIGRIDVRAAADLLGMSVQAVVRIYRQWTLEGLDDAAEELGYGWGLKADVFVGGKRSKRKAEPKPEPKPKAPASPERVPALASMPAMVMSYRWAEPAWTGVPTFATTTAIVAPRGSRRRPRRVTATRRGGQMSYLRRDVLTAR